MKDSDVASNPSTSRTSNAPATYRLVIRAPIVSDEPPQAVESRPKRGALAMSAAGITVLLVSTWAGFNLFRDDSSVPAMNEPARDTGLPQSQPAPSEPAPVADAQDGSEMQSLERGAAEDADAPPSPVKEVIPDAPRSALQTIRGTVRVSIRVTLDRQGAVVDAVSADPGPSRYFERLSLEAARKWVFTPASTDTPRSMLLRFHFTREGATVSARPP